MDQRLRQIAINAYPIHEGDVPGIPRDCPVKRAYKAQMQEKRYHELRLELLEYLQAAPKNNIPDNYVELFFKKHES